MIFLINKMQVKKVIINTIYNSSSYNIKAIWNNL
jgi:hypothetical protein